MRGTRFMVSRLAALFLSVTLLLSRPARAVELLDYVWIDFDGGTVIIPADPHAISESFSNSSKQLRLGVAVRRAVLMVSRRATDALRVMLRPILTKQQ